MTQSNILNVKLPNMQLNTWKPGIIKGTQVNLNLSSNVIGDSNNETNFLCNLLLNNTQNSRPRKVFVNNLSANTKFSKTHLSKMVQLGGFLGKLLGWLIKVCLPLMKNIITSLAKSNLMPLRLMAAGSPTNAAI